MKLFHISLPLKIIIFILIMGLLFYDIIKPINKNNNNFVPLPQIYQDLKQISQTNCKNLTACNDTCVGCDNTFQCTPVAYSENIIYNGQKVPPGKWCLPKGKNRCGSYTGRSVWTKDQGWKCVCLYPNLFNGSDCNNQVACKVLGIPSGEQRGNMLVNTQTGKAWDPLDPTFDPKDTTPYDVDKNNKPLYRCKCDNKTHIKKYISLPNDLYQCHLDPCSDNHEIPFWDGKQCDCTAGGVVKNQYAYSNVTKKCVRTPQCEWDDKKQKCQCANGFVSQVCNSKTMERKGQPNCPNIAGGSYCNNPCEGYCLNGSTGHISGTKCVCSCFTRGQLKFYGDRCDKSCYIKGTYDADDKLNCCNGTTTDYGPFIVAHDVCA